MLETRFKVAILIAVLVFAGLPIMGILRGTSLTPFETVEGPSDHSSSVRSSQDMGQGEIPIKEDMVYIPPGPFIRGYDHGGFDEAPQREIFLDGFSIDRYEVTNHQYEAFVAAAGHRKAGPPSRYAKNMGRMRSANQPVVYVSYDDAQAYCAWKGQRLPSEAEWEKAMRGSDGRLWPWGDDERPGSANWARIQDGAEVTAPAGSFQEDRSPYGVMDGAGNVMEWVSDWYLETAYKDSQEKNPPSPEYGMFRVLRGGSYTTTGGDLRLTSRNKMVPDFRDETIGFRCAVNGKWGGDQERKGVEKSQNIKVVEDEKHGQNDIDNHAGQNYNVKQF
ncbi:MAG: formylglycine-generating enzyme family protein [Nitrospiraceae bacterium]